LQISTLTPVVQLDRIPDFGSGGLTGQGANGEWRKQSYILEIPGSYPKKICIDVWGANIDNFQIKDNEEVTVSIDIESREYNEKWYTNVKAWKVVRGQVAAPAQAGVAAVAQTPAPPPPPPASSTAETPPPEKANDGNAMILEDDLPF